MEIMQVFDCQDMPDIIRTEFYQDHEAGNDSYVKVRFDEFKHNPAHRWDDSPWPLYYQWLLDNGATDNTVLVAHWW